MARDYRYGHKTKQPTVRRTQQDASSLDAASVDIKSEKSSVLTTVASRARAARAKQNVVDVAQASRSAPKRSADVQKIVDEACRLSLPKTIRKEAEQREAEAKKEAEIQAAEQAKQHALALEKKQSRFGWFAWGSMTLLILSGVSWLLYAPFFLAFAFEMQWIDEETRNRLDPAAAMRSQAVATLSKDKQETIKTVAPALTPVADQDAADIQYSFYRELPKANIVTTAQPLPVRTRSPTYLQLASIANDKEAQNERKRLAQKGYLVQMTAQVNKGQTVYVLRMGPYEDQRVINRLKVELQRLGVDAHEVSVISVVKAAEQQATQPVTSNAVANTKPATVVNAPSRADVQQKVTTR